MFSFRYILLAAAALVAATAMPRATPRTLNVSEMNNTVCAIDVKIDVDLKRIPQRIKIMKCANKTDHWCEKNNIKHEDCCHHSQHRHVMECVEMTDTVLVYYKEKNQTVKYTVSVGCTCMIGRSKAAAGVGGPW